LLAPEAENRLVVSVKFHRWKRERNVVANAYADVMPVVRAVGGASFPPIVNKDGVPDDRVIEEVLSGNEDENLLSRTVIEMATQLVRPRDGYWEACPPDSDVMGPTLTRCIDATIQVVNAYRFAEKLMMRAPARERLGPVIIGATRAANPDEGGWDTPCHDVLNTFALYGNQGILRPPSDSVMDEMGRVLFLQGINHPMIPLMDLQTDLNTAFHLDGDFRATVIFSHCASEILLDTAILGMLFEEGRSPTDAARIFDKPLKTRLLTEYHERLGGTWTVSGTKPVARWLRDLLRMRHRVAHSGYAPSYDEARVARDAHFDLGSHLRDRLAVRVKQYPLTAGIIVTSGGFERRNIHTKAAKSAVSLAESARLAEFLAWRSDVLGMRT